MNRIRRKVATFFMKRSKIQQVGSINFVESRNIKQHFYGPNTYSNRATVQIFSTHNICLHKCCVILGSEAMSTPVFASIKLRNQYNEMKQICYKENLK